MRALTLFLGLVAGVASLAFLGVAQLIWAQSEASYYVQLTLAIVLLGNLYLLAHKASHRTLGIAVVSTAFLVASMPVENRLVALSLIAAGTASNTPIGHEIGRAAGFTGQLSNFAGGWLFYSILLTVFAFGVRQWLVRPSLVSEPLSRPPSTHYGH